MPEKNHYLGLTLQLDEKQLKMQNINLMQFPPMFNLLIKTMAGQRCLLAKWSLNEVPFVRSLSSSSQAENNLWYLKWLGVLVQNL